MKKVIDGYKEWAKKYCSKGEIVVVNSSPKVFVVSKIDEKTKPITIKYGLK